MAPSTLKKCTTRPTHYLSPRRDKAKGDKTKEAKQREERSSKEINKTQERLADDLPKTTQAKDVTLEQQPKSSSRKSKSKAGQTITEVTSKEIQNQEQIKDLIVEETVAKIEPKKVSVEIDFYIGKHVGGRLFEGRMISSNFDYPVSLIEPTKSQKENIDKLLDVTTTSEFLVTVNFFIEQYKNRELFELMVTEPVMPVNSFFKKEMEIFQNLGLNEQSKSKWWNHIKDYFTEIFRNVVHGMMYLSSLGYICGDIRNLIYVDKRNQGKILLSLNAKRSEELDFKNLIRKMKEIITLPFKGNVVDISYNVPVELKAFLDFDPYNFKCVPVFWWLNHPFFWSSKERVDFVMSLRSHLREHAWKDDRFNEALKRTSFARQNWKVMVEGRRFKRILNNPREFERNEYDGSRPVQIIRFMVACYNHINDNNCKLKEGTYTLDYVEGHLRKLYPSIYINLYEALYHYENESTGTPSKAKRLKAYKNWSILYFAKKVAYEKNLIQR